jgi:hypothetical protein
MPFDKCLFEILGKLGASELTALCNFLDTKINTLEQELNKALAFTNVFQDQFNQIDQQLRSAESLFASALQDSTLLGVAINLGPNCPGIADVFGSALGTAGVVTTIINDAAYAARQILTVNGIIQTIKNEQASLIADLHDICRIVQLIILENTDAVAEFTSGRVKSLAKFLPNSSSGATDASLTPAQLAARQTARGF